MSRADIERRILTALEGRLRDGVEPGPQTDLIGDTRMDSVAVMDFVLELEDEFDITIPLERMSGVRTVADVARAVETVTASGH
jgi:acyl carrier protein